MSRFHDLGHIHWVGEFIRRTLTNNLNGIPEWVPRSQATVPITKPEDVPRLIYQCLLASEKQIHLEMLDSGYDMVRDTKPQWPGGSDGQDIPWTTLEPLNKLALVHSAVFEWRDTYDALAKCFLKDPTFMTQVSIVKYAKHMLPMLTELQEAEKTKQNHTILKTIFDFFPKFTELLSDVAYALTETPSLGLDVLAALPSRHDVPHDILFEAQEPTAREQITVLSLPEGSRTCSICLNSWIDEVEEPTHIVREMAEDWVKHSRTALEIRDGYEIAPLQMTCGHVFCAECIKIWLNSPGRLQCPFQTRSTGCIGRQLCMWWRS